VPGDPIPSFSPDPALAPTFPDLGGEPAPAIDFARWLDTACFFGSADTVQQWVARLPNVDFSRLMVASAMDSLNDGSFTTLFEYAMRTPGHDATPLLPLFTDLVGGMGGSLPDQYPPAQSNVSIAGRTVSIWDNPQSGPVYAFVSGDTVYGLGHATPELAEQVFPAFP
jgi:hypothetical protein